MIINILSKYISSGILNDILVIKDWFKNHTVNSYETKTTDVIPICDVTFYLEHLPDEFNETKYKVWIPNQEFIYDYDSDRVDKLDAIWCKTKHGEKILKELYDNVSIHYVGFYTLPELKMVPFNKKDKKLAVHMAGSSYLKGTLDVINAWKNIKDVHLFVGISDKIVSKMPEKQKIFNLINQLKLKEKNKFLGMDIRVFSDKNITICNTRLDNKTYEKLIGKAAWHVLPSRVEGYGHSLNMSRLVGSITITTDAPPMNEIITEDSGFLVPVKYTMDLRKAVHSWNDPKNKEVANYVGSYNLYNTIIKAFNTSDIRLIEMVTNAKQNLENEKIECYTKANELFNILIKY